MANFSPQKNRRVIPNWRSFTDTAANGELDSFQNKARQTQLKFSIDSYIADWLTNKTVGVAADLISAATVNGFTINQHVLDATNFILSPENQATPTQKRLAERILRQAISNKLHLRLIKINSDDFLEHVDIHVIRKKIQELKKLRDNFPKNAIYCVEISRLYLILGQNDQAIKNMSHAIQLAPDNRFVLRCAVRLFTHIDENDYAHSLLKRNGSTGFDPWLTSAEVSLATLRGKPSKFLKKGLEIIRSKNFSPFSISELSSSIGTLELLDGNRKKSREFFNISLLHPNDNSMAQAEWAISKDKHLLINPVTDNVSLNFEALAIDSLHNEKYKEALDNSARWFFDLPFSKRPVLFGSFVAGVMMDNQEKARDFLRAGLLSSPFDPHLINNLAYSLALENKIDEAQKEIDKVSATVHVDEQTEICLMATQGLINFRKGLHDIGRALYLTAIEKSRDTKDLPLNWTAILNYAREEILAKTDHVDSIMNVVAKMPEVKEDEIELQKLKIQVETLYNKAKNINFIATNFNTPKKLQ